MNPRLWKEAFFYEKKGFDVVILSMWHSKESLKKDWQIVDGHLIKYKAYLNLIPGEINPLSLFFYRLRKRLAGELQRLGKYGTGWAISYSPGLMFKKALQEDAVLYVAHLECAFYVGRDLIKAGKKVIFDFEDWYSRDYLVPARPVKLLKAAEKYALQNGLFCTAASNSMAIALKECYNSENKITVIYNGFSIKSKIRSNFIKDEGNERIKLLWFSRTIGAGRGLELLLKGLLVCNAGIELHLLGEMKAGYLDFLEREFANQSLHNLVIHPFIPHAKLDDFISQFKIGLAIEENINDNKRLTVSNKILQYLQAGLMVLASDTKGQREVAELFPGAVTIVDIHNPEALAMAIVQLSKKKDINTCQQKEKFESIFSWEAQEIKLNSLIEKFL
ncbi:glycosyltransferase [Ferruginibacter paludis]|uniref:glycosyltransferase n=1 Tax=Ferruginibacter paludis TaxID=1310417 RepID=UPI0025B2DBEE|nr:glycosyltransferase [Ferruginibacter paludis]MDN3655859.1 glycosyltransferase [Ferruginibacter paludis]